MKLSTLVLVCAGLALAKTGDTGKKADRNNSADAAAAANSNSTDAAADNSNSTAVAASNSTDAGSNTQGNGTANNGNNNNGNNLVQEENGAPCINVDALSNVK